MTKKKLHIKTYGCQMNFYDSGRMVDLMKPLGFEMSDEVDGSDLVILNTCHIREKAAEKVYSVLGRIRESKEKMKQDGKQMVIAVAGCVAQAEGKEIKTRAPFVDIVVGSQAYQRLPQLVSNALGQSGEVVDLDFSTNEKFDLLPEQTDKSSASAFLTIQEGCDKFCTFCVVPYTRGEEYSRNVPEIYREAIRLVENGAIEITLLGQNVNAYHGKGPDGDVWGLGGLIRHLSKIKGLERIRYTTSHPRDMDGDLIAAHGEVDKLMPFLHLPVQSGSDKILKAMNRKHTADEYRYVIDKLRKSQPDLAMCSDFIVGFPGETDKDFQDTMKLIRDVGYTQAYSFKYSPRPGTPAAGKEDQVTDQEKDGRLAQLQAEINKQQAQFNKESMGQVVKVLLDRKGKLDGQLSGRTAHMQSVYISCDNKYFNQMVDVKVEKTYDNSLSGSIITAEDDDLKIAASA